LASIDTALQQAQQLPFALRALKEEALPDGGEVDRDGFRKVRRVELLARLELLDELIEDQARRAEVVQEMGWDATPYEQRSKLLKASRQRYLVEFRQLLSNDPARDEHANDGAGTNAGGAPAAHPP